MITGHCECGRITYEIDGPVKDFSHCHCSQCRRLHGAAFVSFAGVAKDAVRYTNGEDDLQVYASSDAINRFFCRVCGSPILCDFIPEPDMLYVCMGTMDGNPELPDGYHQFVAFKSEWYEIADSLPQHEEWPPDQPPSSDS